VDCLWDIRIDNTEDIFVGNTSLGLIFSLVIVIAVFLWIAVFVVFTGGYHPGSQAPTVVPSTMRPVSPAQLYAAKKDCVRNLGRDIAASERPEILLTRLVTWQD
jgi:hypothetical protein